MYFSFDVQFSFSFEQVLLVSPPSMQLSYGASSPSLSTTEMFPNFYRTIPSEVQSNSARFALMQRFNWERVATLHETQTIFSQVCGSVIVHGRVYCTCSGSSSRSVYLFVC